MADSIHSFMYISQPVVPACLSCLSACRACLGTNGNRQLFVCLPQLVSSNWNLVTNGNLKSKVCLAQSIIGNRRLPDPKMCPSIHIYRKDWISVHMCSRELYIQGGVRYDILNLVFCCVMYSVQYVPHRTQSMTAQDLHIPSSQ